MPDETLLDRIRRVKKERDESAFRADYSETVKKRSGMGQPLSENPDAPEHKYDYRGAFKKYGSGMGMDETGHFPSEFKADDHPNRFVDGVDTKTGLPVPARGDLLRRIRSVKAASRQNPDEPSALEGAILSHPILMFKVGLLLIAIVVGGVALVVSLIVTAAKGPATPRNQPPPTSSAAQE